MHCCASFKLVFYLAGAVNRCVSSSFPDLTVLFSAPQPVLYLWCPHSSQPCQHVCGLLAHSGRHLRGNPQASHGALLQAVWTVCFAHSFRTSEQLSVIQSETTNHCFSGDLEIWYRKVLIVSLNAGTCSLQPPGCSALWSPGSFWLFAWKSLRAQWIK